MPQVTNLFFKTAVIWLILGLAVGMTMGISGNHNMIATHAHLNLLGWASSAIFAGYYFCSPRKSASRIALAHYWIYTAGLCLMLSSLGLEQLGALYAGPFIALGSVITCAGVLIFVYVVFSSKLGRETTTV